MNFKEEQKKRIEQIEAILMRYLPKQEGKQKIIMEAMEYSLMAGGKRLRPMLMWETYRDVFRNIRSNLSVYGGNRDDSYVLPCA